MKEQNLFEKNDGCTAYLNYKNICANDRLNKAFNEVSDLLDKNFIDEFSKHFYERTWELLIASQIKKAHDKNPNLFKIERHREKGPDFGLTFTAADTEKKMWLECVCPQKATIENVGRGDSQVYVERKTPTHTSTLSNGIDDYIASRFTSSLGCKNQQYEKYIQDGTVGKDDFKIVCVYGLPLSKVKGSRNSVEFLNLSEEITRAISGGRQCMTFTKDQPARFECLPHTITKNNGSKINHQYFLFDAVIYSAHEPCSFPLYGEGPYSYYLLRDKNSNTENDNILKSYLDKVFKF